MFKPTRYTWLGVATFLVGILLGCTCIAFLLVTNFPVPNAPDLLAMAAVITPLGVALLAACFFWPVLRPLATPILGLLGMALPIDMAYACLLGWFPEDVLRQAIGLLFAVAAGLVAIPVSTYHNRLGGAKAETQVLPSPKRARNVQGVSQ